MHTANIAGRENASDTFLAGNDQHKINEVAMVVNVTDKGEQSIIRIGIGINTHHAIHIIQQKWINKEAKRASNLNWGGVEAGVADVPDKGADTALEVGHGAARAAAGAAHPLDVVRTGAIGAGPHLGHGGSLELQNVFRQPNRARASARLILSAEEDEPNRTQPWIGFGGGTTAQHANPHPTERREEVEGARQIWIRLRAKPTPQSNPSKQSRGGYRHEKEEIVASAGWMDLHSTPVQLQQRAGRRRRTRETPLHRHRHQRGLQFKDPGPAVQPRRRRRGRRRCGTTDSGGVEKNLVGETEEERERGDKRGNPPLASSPVESPRTCGIPVLPLGPRPSSGAAVRRDREFSGMDRAAGSTYGTVRAVCSGWSERVVSDHGFGSGSTLRLCLFSGA
jgi:hypothetical protein